MWTVRALLLSFLVFAPLLSPVPASAQDADDDVFDFWLSEAFVRRLADENTIAFQMRLSMDHRTRKVHTLKDDCEIHIAASVPTSGSATELAWPPAVVVEPPNLCKERAPGMPRRTSETVLRTTLWPKYLDRHVMGRECEVVGFPRIFTEHAAGNADPANPNHVLELHPALGMTCGDFSLELRAFLKAYAGMRQIKPETMARCLEGRRLSVRKRGARYEFRQTGGGPCGNFAVVQATINPAWVRAISGGHSAIARVSPGGRGPFTLKLYTYDGTAEDRLLADIAQGREPGRRLYVHGMLTYDYFSIVKAVRDRDGTWQDVPDWRDVPFPLALVVFGETEVREAEE